jgi:hypothetical protein
VTKVLTVVAQAAHGLVPPDALEPVVQAIANNFVSDHCAAEVMTVGCAAAPPHIARDRHTHTHTHIHTHTHTHTRARACVVCQLQCRG